MPKWNSGLPSRSDGGRVQCRFASLPIRPASQARRSGSDEVIRSTSSPPSQRQWEIVTDPEVRATMCQVAPNCSQRSRVSMGFMGVSIRFGGGKSGCGVRAVPGERDESLGRRRARGRHAVGRFRGAGMGL